MAGARSRPIAAAGAAAPPFGGRGRFVRRWLAAVAALFTVAASAVLAQAPSAVQAQLELLRNLPPAERRALLGELLDELPAGERAALLGRIGSGAASRAASAAADAERAAGVSPRDVPEGGPARFAAGDTLVIEFRATDANRAGFAERLAEGNPYELDEFGRLALPGVPLIALAGLTVGEANVRLNAEPALRGIEVRVTRLPLEPFGLEALELFGYDLFDGVPSTFAPVTDIPVPADYVIGPGDTIRVQLFGNVNAEYELAVNRDGTINFPEIGPIAVSGLTFDALRETIDTRVGEQMIGVRASTTLGALRSIRVFVLGDVVRPGSYTVSGLATMTHALFASGGVKRIGSLRNVALRRNGETVATLDLYDLLLRGDTTGDARLEPGDVIFVPPIGATVAVDGEVRRPAIYELKNERTVGDLVALAGGFTARANRATAKLERIVPGRGRTVVDLDLRTEAGREMPLRDGDVLRVFSNPGQLENAVELIGNVYEPGLYEWRDGMRLTELLPSPEAVKPLSDLHYVLVRREIAPNVERAVFSVDLRAIWDGRAADVRLEPRDAVYVFGLELGRQQYIGPIIAELRAQAGPNEPPPVVSIDGEVRAPGDYPLEAGMRVSDLLRAGGGLRDSAYTIEAELVRYRIVDGERRVTEVVDLDLDAIRAGNERADLALVPYDHLSVKQVSGWRGRESVTILGEVAFPGTYPIRDGERLSSVIARAGGLTEHAYPQGSVFTRVALREREREEIDRLAQRLESDVAALSLSDPNATEAIAVGRALVAQLRSATPVGRLVIRLDEILAGRSDLDIVLEDGDRLIVPRTPQSVAVIGEVQNPTSHLYERGLAIEEYIDKSGGLAPRADRKRIYVVRANGEVVPAAAARWFRRSAAGGVQPGDTIVVPLDVERIRPLARWTNVTQVVYSLAIAAAAVNSF